VTAKSLPPVNKRVRIRLRLGAEQFRQLDRNPVWTGVGTIGTAILGIVLFGEDASVARLLCIGLIVAGIAGLKLVSPY
jgi:hypothetical protein